jgi:prepilin-type N-terminal cleavage/methylation domain-containing protein
MATKKYSVSCYPSLLPVKTLPSKSTLATHPNMMITTFRRHAAKGFTLIELLIVVIIIAILAAIAIPQFANTSGDAQEAALDANLNTMRSAIELYRVQHRNSFPAAVVTAATSAETTACTAAGGAVTTLTVNTEAAFIAHLTGFSTSSGAVCSVAAPAGGFALGPYLRAIPNDGLSNPPTAAVAMVTTTGNAAAPAPTGTTGGWQYDSRDGRIRMNSNATGRRGTPLFNY